MTAGWVKSLQCKSRALDDVVTRYGNPNKSSLHYHHLVPDSTSCLKSVQGLKDVIETNKRSKHRKPKPQEQLQKLPKRVHSRKPDSVSEEGDELTRSKVYTRRPEGALLPALTELPEGHPSRNVVEIIFHTSWSPKSFSGRVEMVFKVQNLTRTLSRFEEYREIVKARARSGGGVSVDESRCIADGNEVMRFYCLGPTSGGAYDAGGGAWGFYGRKGVSMCTYAGSGGAHEKAGGGNGRRAMLVCRVISGRVLKETGCDPLVEGPVEYDSVSRENDELLVFDSRAVLPCFLIIYKL